MVAVVADAVGIWGIWGVVGGVSGRSLCGLRMHDKSGKSIDDGEELGSYEESLNAGTERILSETDLDDAPHFWWRGRGARRDVETALTLFPLT
jgi:hypothetical protein